MNKNIRATLRTAAALIATPGILGLSALQGLVVGPLTHNYTVIPKLIYKTLGKIFGYKIVFNEASAPLVKDKSAWFAPNHISNADFIIAGSALNGTFAGKSDIQKWPIIAQIARSTKYIGIRRKSQYNPETRGKIVRNFNDGRNTITFFEGTTTDGKEVGLFRAALPELLFEGAATDKKNRPVALKKDVVVQPIAILVKSVNGQDAVGNDGLRGLYTMRGERKTLRRIWKRFQLRETTIELTAFPPLDPKDFPKGKEGAMALANKAAQDIASVVNPGQTTFKKAEIPVPRRRNGP